MKRDVGQKKKKRKGINEGKKLSTNKQVSSIPFNKKTQVSLKRFINKRKGDGNKRGTRVSTIRSFLEGEKHVGFFDALEMLTCSGETKEKRVRCWKRCPFLCFNVPAGKKKRAFFFLCFLRL